MKILMIANVKYSEIEGIFKKIIAQAKGLSSENKECILICNGEVGILKLVFFNGKLIDKYEVFNHIKIKGNINNKIKELNNLLKVSKEIYYELNPTVVYIRHMVPNYNLIAFLKQLKYSTIYYEIPTYPYFYEQLNSSNNKIRTIIRLIIESVFWPFIYFYIDKLLVICSNNKVLTLKKMRHIYNGIDLDNIPNYYIKKDTSSIHMIGVGTIFAYHGYDLILQSLKECSAKTKDGTELFFHLVGESELMKDYEKWVKKNGLEKNVFFYGKRYGNELDEIFNKCNIGIGCIALHRRNANIDTAIKNIEYLTRGLPVLTSGNIFHIIDEEKIKVISPKKIDWDEISIFIKKYYEKDRTQEINLIRKQFDWNNIMKEMLENE